MFRKILISAALIAGSSVAMSGPVLLDEGFDGGTGVPGGWLVGYFSNPAGTTGWFQGNSGIFDAESGAADSYLAANYLNTAESGGNIDTWLATPVLSSEGSISFSFAARSGGALPGDEIEILVNALGSNLASDFVSMGNITGLPVDAWGFYNFLYTGDTSNVRFAFRYHVTDTTANGDYIGIDSVTAKVPEPGTLALFALGMLLTPLVLRRRRARI